MRTKKSFKNMTIAIISNIITIIIGFVIQTIFIKTLGTDYLGVDKLFSNIISMLSIVDLGIGSAIIYNMYAPVENDDKEKIKSLMSFYKKAYNIIIALVAVIGFSFIPFLGFIVHDANIGENITIIYILVLLDMIASYVLAYKKSILYADQKNYYVIISRICYLIVMNSLLISCVLLTTRNYYLYLIIKIVMRLLENVVMSIIVDKKYSYLKDKDCEELDKDTKEDIYTKIKGLLFHKVGTFLVLGTDNIIISAFLGVAQVGYYSNYRMVIFSVLETINQGFSAITSSIGNLLVSKNKNKSFGVYKKIDFFNFWVSSFCTISIFVIIESFINLWIGEEFILAKLVLISLTINFYLSSVRAPMNSFKEAAGIFHEDRFIPLIESFVNVVASIVLLQFFGLAGVFMGTILSGLVLHFYSYPKYVYKKLFNRSYISYFRQFFKKFIIMLVTLILTYFVASLFKFDNKLIQVGINIIICLIVPNVIYLVIFARKEEFKYFKDMAFKYLKKFKKTRLN